MPRDWHQTEQVRPSEGEVVETCNFDRLRDEQYQHAELLYERNLWWLPDRSMYVYYTPTLWRFRDAA